MDDDRFRPPFGFRGSNFGSGRGSPPTNPFDDEEDDSQFGSFGEDLFSRFRFGNFGRSSGNDLNDDIFRGAETILRHMDAMFRDMNTLGGFSGSGAFGQILGSGIFDDQRGGTRDAENPYTGSRRSPRDEMLKVPDSDTSVTVWEPLVEGKNDGSESSVSGQVFPNKKSQTGGWSSWSGSSSVTSFSGFGDGKTEEKRTIQHSDGSKSVIVKRRLGEKELTITTTINRDGETEVTENFLNMDETEKDDFVARWNSNSPAKRIQGDVEREDNGGRELFPTAPKLDPHAPSIFSKIFGSWLK